MAEVHIGTEGRAPLPGGFAWPGQTPWRSLSIVTLVALILTIVALLLQSALRDVVRAHDERLYPGVRIEGYDVAGKTRAEAASILAAEIERRRALTVGLVALEPHFGQTSLDRTQAELGVVYDLDAALQEAYASGRTGDLLTDALTLIVGRSGGPDTTIPVRVDRPAVRRAIEASAAAYDQAPRDAAVRIVGDRVIVTSSVPGRRLDVEASIAAVESSLPLTESGQITLVAQPLTPAIDDEDAERAYAVASAYLAGPVSLQADEVRARVDVRDLARALTVERVENAGGPLLRVRFDPSGLVGFVSSLRPAIDRPATSATFAVDADRVSVASPSQIGRRLDVDATTARLMGALTKTGSERAVPMAVEYTRPRLTEDAPDVRQVRDVVQTYLSGPLTFTIDGKQARLEPHDLARLLSLEQSREPDESLRLRLDTAGLISYLNSLRALTDVPAQSVGFKIAGGRAVVTSPSQAGRRLDVDATTALALAALSKTTERTVSIAVESVTPRLTEQEVTSWVKVASASTVYESARDRMYNIELAAQRLDHIAIDPGKTFSLNGALGAQDASNGYRTAFVIVNERTQPGPGGGLCQVATTLFQAAFWGGYKILDRTEHSYWIPRYASVSPDGKTYLGLDAAIDTGAPDMVFVNNGPGFLYIHMRTDGHRLYVDLYGPKPDWKVDIAEYWVGNYRRTAGQVVRMPEPTLPSGSVVKVEDARNGFDAKVTRVVTRSSGELVDRATSRSTFRPTNTVYLEGTGGRR